MIRSVGVFLIAALVISGCDRSDHVDDLGRSIKNGGYRAVPLARVDGLPEGMQRVIHRRRQLLSAVLADPGSGRLEHEVAFGELGIVYLAAGLPGPAEPCFANAADGSSQPFRWVYYQAQSWAALENHEHVVEVISRALAHEPTSEVALILLGESYVKLNRLPEAGAVFAEAARYHPRSAAAYYGIGRVCLARGEPEDAITHLSRSLELQPQADRVHYPLAQALRAVGDLEAAEQHLSRRGLIRPAPIDELMDRVAMSNPHTVYRRGLDALRSGGLATAVRLLGWSAELQPEFFEGRLNNGIALARSGQLEAALAEVDAAGSLQTGNPRVLYNRGTILLRLGRLDDARIALAKSLEVNPDHAPTHFNLAAVLRDLGRDEEAEVHFGETIRIEPNHGAARLWQARLRARNGRCGAAVTALSEADAVMPEDVEIQTLLAQMLAACDSDRERDGARGLVFATRAFEARPAPATAGAVAVAYASLGDFENAALWQHKAIVLLAENSGAPPPEMQRRLERYEAGEWAPLPW